MDTLRHEIKIQVTLSEKKKWSRDENLKKCLKIFNNKLGESNMNLSVDLIWQRIVEIWKKNRVKILKWLGERFRQGLEKRNFLSIKKKCAAAFKCDDE